jgi:hypothetical protein
MTDRAPAGSGPAGKRLWSTVLERYTLEPHELELLRRACRAADVLEEIERAGTLLPGSVEFREWRLTCITEARLLAGLRLPSEPGERPQRRQLRGVHMGAVGV